MGSVKDLEVAEKPTKNSMGIGRFHFSDRYSIFDWGEMPDHIEGKGSALCLMGAYCFERIEEGGVDTHYRGLVTEEKRVVAFDELKQPTNIMEFNLVNVFRPRVLRENGQIRYDYDVFSSSLRNYLIPLEIIYRNGLPEGSSIFKRLEDGQITLKDLGLDHYPKPGERFSKPIFDVSTKLEEKDRYLTWDEAKKIAGLTGREVKDIKDLLLKVDEMITEVASRASLENEDGKIELAFSPERRLMVVDVVGTLDECRFAYEGFHVSKEVARRFYQRTDWYRHVEDAKKKAEVDGVKDWRKLCRSDPPRLDSALKALMGEMYASAANELTGRRLFPARHLAEVVKEYRDYSCSTR